MSNKQLRQLSNDGETASLIERAANVVVIIDPNEEAIITVLHDNGSKNSRKYRSQWPTRSQKRRRQNGEREYISANSLCH